jgi:hypothetical protein
MTSVAEPIDAEPIFAEHSQARAVTSSSPRSSRTTCTEKAMPNRVRTAAVLVCELFIGGLGAIGMSAQAHAQGWVAVAADSKGRWGYAFGKRTSAQAQVEALRGCGARGCDIQDTARARCPYGEPCGWILVRRRPRSHTERGCLHGPERMRAGSAGSNVPSREGPLRVTDRDVSAGCAPARTSQRTSTYSRT